MCSANNCSIWCKKDAALNFCLLQKRCNIWCSFNQVKALLLSATGASFLNVQNVATTRIVWMKEAKVYIYLQNYVLNAQYHTVTFWSHRKKLTPQYKKRMSMNCFMKMLFIKIWDAWVGPLYRKSISYELWL